MKIQRITQLIQYHSNTNLILPAHAQGHSILLQKKLWKYNLAEATVGLLDVRNTYSYSEVYTLRLLKSAKESNFFYLPIQISHFEPIRNFMPVDR